MTVDELNNVWLERNKPQSVIKFWSIKNVDFSYSSDDCERYDKTYNDVKDLKVKCFTTYHIEKPTDKNISIITNYLIINVE